MSKGKFTYCLLQYHHSQILGEVFNIGLMVYYPNIKQLHFIYPEKLIRLRFAYPNVSEKTIKAYFKYFDARVQELNNDPEIFSDHDLSISLEYFVHKEFLPSDSSALQFGNFRTSVLYTDDVIHLNTQLYNLYFSVFNQQESVKKVDESILLIRYKDLLKEYAKHPLAIRESSTFKLNYTISPPDNLNYTFDIAWKSTNDLHLVKPVSFDLLREDSINRKAHQYYGQFIDLQEYAKEKTFLFDLILAKPKARSLFKAYDNAIRLLSKPQRVELVELDYLSQYSKTTATAALL